MTDYRSHPETPDDLQCMEWSDTQVIMEYQYLAVQAADRIVRSEEIEDTKLASRLEDLYIEVAMRELDGALEAGIEG